MIENSISIYFDHDEKLGDYFQKCGTRTEYLLNQYDNIKQTQITGDSCNFVYVNDVVLPQHCEPTLLIIYSHGNEEEFAKPPTPAFFGNYTEKPQCLDNGIVYSNACLVGSKFGKNLGYDNSSFFGYDKTVSIHKDYINEFIECDIHGLYHILRGKTLEEAKERAKVKFNEKISQVLPFVASYLRQARDSIVIYGDTTTPFF